MLCMETYLFCFSVRLGILLSATLSFISLFIPWLLLLIYNLKMLQPIVDLLNADKDLHENHLIIALKDMIVTDSTELKVILHIVLVVHMLSNILAIYGALKLKKMFVIPLAICECIRVIYGLVSHIILMQASHSQISLSLLIVATLAGGFLLLFWAYNCCACIAFYQIINLINSSKYRQLYGDDPFNPIIAPGVNDKYDPKHQILTSTKSVNGAVIPEHNYRSVFRSKKYDNQMKATFISVLPINFHNSNFPIKKNYKEEEWQKRPPLQLQKQPQKYSNMNINYNYWQWRELPQYQKNINSKNVYIKNYWY